MRKGWIILLGLAALLCIGGLGIAFIAVHIATDAAQDASTAVVATIQSEQTLPAATRQFNAGATVTAVTNNRSTMQVTNSSIDNAIAATNSAKTRTAPTSTFPR